MTVGVAEAQLIAVGLATARVAGVCITAPVLASRAVPRRIALAFALALAVASLPTVASAQHVDRAWTASALLASGAAELGIGALLGFMAVLPIAAFRAAGALMGVQMGMGFGGLYDGSSSDADADETHGLEMLLGLAATAMFVWAGGLESLSLGVLRSFDYLPLAHGLTLAALPALVGRGLLACAELALRVAMPVTAVLVAETLVTGLISRTVPSVGPVQFGFPVRVLIAMVALLAGAAAMKDALSGASAAALDSVHQWATGGAA